MGDHYCRRFKLAQTREAVRRQTVADTSTSAQGDAPKTSSPSRVETTLRTVLIRLSKEGRILEIAYGCSHNSVVICLEKHSLNNQQS